MSSPACVYFAGIWPPSGHADEVNVITCTTPRPRPPPRWPGWAGGAGWAGGPGWAGGLPRCWAIASVEHNAINAIVEVRWRMSADLLEGRGLRLAPGVVAHAERLDRVEVLALANHVRPVIRRGLRHGEIHRVFPVVVRVAAGIPLLRHQDVRDVRGLLEARNRRLRPIGRPRRTGAA